MTDSGVQAVNQPPPRRLRWLCCGILVAVAATAVGAGAILLLREDPPPIKVRRPPPAAEASESQVRQFCGACHAYPPPATLPRSVWRKEVKQGFDLFRQNPKLAMDFPTLESVAQYYQKRAPEKLEVLTQTSRRLAPGRFEPRGFRPPDRSGAPAVAHVQLAPLFHKDRLDIIVCEVGANQIWALQAYQNPPAWQLLASGHCCARVEVVDLDGDGHKDLLLACLGNFYATNDKVGSVVWLRGSAAGKFQPIPLLEGVGRVADVRAADFNGDGKLDLVVAVFGWRETGEILSLENQTADWSRPKFAARTVDPRHGASHLPVADLDGDGHTDFVALISQEHETVVAFLNDGKANFRPKTIYAAPHPTFGFSGLQLIDLDSDGDLDLLVANGDTLDAPYLLKPYHGVQWLENRGDLSFVPHRLMDMHGAVQAVAHPMNGDKNPHIAVVSYLPAHYYPQRDKLQLDSIVLLEPAAGRSFVPYALETTACDHLTCAFGDVDGDGRVDLVTGQHSHKDRSLEAVTVWRNLGGRKGKERGAHADFR
jgi:hypothetical protein